MEQQAENAVTLETAVAECLAIPEFIYHYDRLTGNHMQRVLKATPIEQMVDDATGFRTSEFKKFIDFVYVFVWSPLIAEKGQSHATA